MKGELQELGEEVDENVDSISKVQTQILNLTHGKVNIFDDEGNFRDIYEILQDISSIYYDLSDPDRANLLEILAGKNRANALQALIDNWSNVEKATEAAYNAAGTAQQEQDIWMDSLQGHLTQLSVAWQTLANDFLSSDFLKGGTDILTGLLDGLDTVINKIGTIPTIIGGISAAMSLKNVGIFTTLNTDLDGFINKIGVANVSISDLMNAFRAGSSSGSGITSFVNGLKSMQNAMSKTLTKTDISNITAYNAELDKGVSAQTAWYRTMQTSSNAAKEMVAGANGGKVALTGLSASASTSTLAMVGLRVATIALNMALTMGLAIAIQAVVKGLTHLINKDKEAAEAAKDAADAAKQKSDEYQDELSTIDDLIAKYIELKGQDQQDVGTRQSIKEIQEQITSLVGEQASNLDLVNGKLDDELSKLYLIQRTEAENAQKAANNAYEKSKESANKAIGENSRMLVNGYEYVGDVSKAEREALGNYLQAFSVQGALVGGAYGLNFKDTQSLLKSFYDIDVSTVEGKIDALDEMMRRLETVDGFAESELYNGLQTAKEYYQEYANAITDASNDLLSSTVAYETAEEELYKLTVDDADSFEEYRQKLLENVLSDDFIKGKLDDGYLTTDSIENYVDNYLATLDSFSGAYADWLKQYHNQVDDATDEVIDQYDELKQKFANEDISEWFEGLSESDKEIVYKIGLESDDTTLYTLDMWKSRLQGMKDASDTTKSSISSFYDLVNDTGDNNFSDYIDNYTKKISTLQDALSKISTGELTEQDKISLALDFPDLADKINDTDALTAAIQSLIDTSNEGMNDYLDALIQQLAEDTPEATEQINALRDALNGLTTTTDSGWNFDLDDEITKFDNLYAAMKESVSGTGLSSKSMANVKSMFQDLDGYDPSKLFERTANGIHMNTTELRNLQAQYEKQKKADIDEHLQSLIDDYHDLQKEIATCTDFTERANKISQLENLQNDITAVADLAAQYEGLTSAYNKWIQAQSAGEEGDMYDSIRSSYGDMQEMYEQGLVGTNAFRTYVDLLSSADLSTAPVDDIISAYERLGQTIEGTSYSAIDFLADGSDGCLNFLHAVQDLNTDWAKMNEDGSWDINFGVGNDKEVADALGIDVEYVQSLMRKLSDYGFDINLDSAYTSIDKLGTYAETANEKLKELGATDIDFNFDTTSIDDVNSQIEEAQSLLDTFKNTDGTVNTSLEGATEAEAVLIALITRKQELSAPSVMSVDTSNANSNIEETIGLLKDFQTNYNDIEIETAVGADTSEAQTNIQSVLTSIDSMPDEVKTSLGLDDADFQAALETLTSTEVDVQAGVNLDTSALETIQSTISGITPEMMVTAGLDSSLIDGYEPPDKSNEVTYSVNDSAVKSYSAPQKTGTVVYNAYMNSWTAPTKYGTVIYTVRTVGSAPSNGTANSLGIGLASGTAFAKGDWGAKKSGVALGGEVGTEIVVRNGKFFTVGEDGAEFFKYKKDDIK